MDKLLRLRRNRGSVVVKGSALSPCIIKGDEVNHVIAVWVSPRELGWPWIKVSRKVRRLHGVEGDALMAADFSHYEHAVKLVDWMRRQSWWSHPCDGLEGVSPAEVFEHLVRGYAERKVGPVQVAGAIRKMAFTIVGSIQGRVRQDDDERSLGGILGGTDSGESQPGGDALPSNGEAGGGEDG